jgi:NADH-quinone oxidoreductase subunit K
MTFSIIFYFIFSMIVFCIGLVGLIIAKKNNFLLLISLEILFLSCTLNFFFASLFLDDIFGLTFIMFILAIAGSEISIGLALFILLYRVHNFSLSDSILNLKG